MRKRGNDFWVVGDIAYVDVSTDKFPQAVALVDLPDLHFIEQSQHRWFASTTARGIYAMRNAGRRGGNLDRLHRLILPDVTIPDHKNRDGLDNRRSNLRPATHSENARNQIGKSSTSQFKGVSWCKQTGSWKAQISFDKKTKNLGRFKDEIVAARAYDAAARDAFGDFALLNFPLTEAVAA